MLQGEVLMLYPFFAQAGQSPTRQFSFRRTVAVHLFTVGCGVYAAARQPMRQGNEILGNLLLVAGIVEGAMLVGWRLGQMPKSQALEFLLVSPLRPFWLFVAEAAVGITFLALVTLSGLPVLMLLMADGRLHPLDPLVLSVMPFTWGAVTGLGLAVWAYEPARVRRWGEFISMLGILIYLLVGVLAGENLRHWVNVLPEGLAVSVLRGFRGMHTHNPFGIMRDWMTTPIDNVWERAAWIQGLGVLIAVCLLLRAAARLQPHFHKLHYQPAADVRHAQRTPVGERPLAWWAVKRVTRYSGRINLYLAWGFGAAYATFLLAGPHWPAWMGKRVFEICEANGGVAGLVSGLVILAAVPAAFQYGLWDSNAQDRCRRLELLLLTRLEARDYWEAASAAAWRRGKGYLGVALVLSLAGLAAGRTRLPEALAAGGAAAILWALYFALGFRGFARGGQANGVGILLTVGLPFAAYALSTLGMAGFAGLLPPGMVHGAYRGPGLVWLAGPLAMALLSLAIARHSLRTGDRDLRRWYDLHHGQKVAG
jgi:hypothetical protein